MMEVRGRSSNNMITFEDDRLLDIEVDDVGLSLTLYNEYLDTEAQLFMHWDEVVHLIKKGNRG